MARRTYKRKRSRKRGSRTIPLLPAIGLFATQASNLGNSEIGTKGPLGSFIDSHNLEYLAHDEVLTFTGYDIRSGAWNPMDAKGLILMGIMTLASKAAGRFVNPTIRKLPVIGKWVKL